MNRTMRAFGTLLLLAATGLHAGCGGGASGLTSAAAETSGMTNEHPLARPTQVAWTSAKAQRCGFNFDPTKLRASYIAYEQRQGAAGDQLNKIQSAYDTTFKSISSRVSGDADYCTDKKSAEIKADLTRHLAGDYGPNFPKAKSADNVCGFFGCSEPTDPNEKFSSKKLFEDLNKKQNGTAY
jgi:hypothetical protein